MAYIPQADVQESLQEIQALTRNMLALYQKFSLAFDTAGRMRVNTDQIGGATTLPVTVSSGTVTTVTTVTTATTVGTVTALANLAPAGVTNPTHQLLNPLAAMGLRDRITVTP